MAAPGGVEAIQPPPTPLQADTAATPKTLDHPHRSPSLPLISRFGARTRGKPPLTINAATIIAFAGKNVQVDRRHLLRPSRAPNRTEPPRTLAIEPLFTTYFTGRRHRLPCLQPIPDHLNLTFGIASQSYGSEACINPGAYMEVTYRGVQIAASAPETWRICAKPRKAVEQHVLTIATTIPVGKVLDSLEEEMLGGVAMFDITLHLPAGSYDLRNAWVSGCNGMPVGQDAVACESLF